MARPGESEIAHELRQLSQAEAASAREAWAEAATLWAGVVAANPVEGRFWTRLGEARHQSGDFRAAIAAYEHAFTLRDGYPAETAYAIARCFARLGELAAAMHWLEQAWDLGFRSPEQARDETDFAPLRDDPRFRQMTGLIEPGLSRDDGWRVDLAFFAQEVKRRAYDPFRHVSETWFDERIAVLTQAIPTLTDAQIIVELEKLLRPLGDGHAYVHPPADQPDLLQTLPVQFYLFEEGLFIIAADSRYGDLVGAEVLRIGERPVAEVMAALDPVITRDNDYWPKEQIPYRLRETPLLHALGLIPAPDHAILTIHDRAGQTRTVPVAADPDLSATPIGRSFPHPASWVFYPETLPEPLPLYLRHLHEAYWFTHLPEQQTVYVQFNQVRDDPREPLAAFGDRLFSFIAAQPVAKLVIDLRWNKGGNTFLELPFLHRLIGCGKINRRGSLFVIIGRRTFSAAQNFTSLLDRHTEAIFVGEPTGSSPTFIGESVEFVLPFSQVRANVSDLLWQSTWPMDYRPWIAPTIYCPPTFAAYRANRDPALDAILAWSEHLPGW